MLDAAKITFFLETTKKFARNLQLIISPLIIPPLS